MIIGKILLIVVLVVNIQCFRAPVRPKIDLSEVEVPDVEDVSSFFHEDVVCNDDLPQYLTYGQYNQKKITENELRKRIDTRIEHNCKFCEYPLYRSNFHHFTGKVTRSDAFTTDHGDYIVLMTHIVGPVLKGRKKVKNEVNSNHPSRERLYNDPEKFEDVVLLVYPVTSCQTEGDEADSFSTSPILIEVEDLFMSDAMLLLKFPIKEEHKWILETCFYVFLKDGKTGHEIVKKPILVRHCHEDERKEDDEKRDKLAICAMLDNKDLWLVEWIEWHRMMGVSHFYLYMHQSLKMKESGEEGYYDTTFSLLDPLVNQGIVSLYLWNYTRDKDYWGKDQRAAINDCLWRFKDRTKFLLLNDNDEFAVPYEGNDILSVLEELEKENKIRPGYYLTEFNFGEHRTNTSRLTTKMYVSLKQILKKFPKMIIRTKYVNLTNLHHLDNLVRDMNRFLHPQMSKAITVNPKGGPKGMFLAHYTERKYHEYNKIVSEGEEPVEDVFDIQWVYDRVQDFTEELERRVEKLEEELDVAQYGYDYHVFNPEERGDDVKWAMRYEIHKSKLYQKDLDKLKENERMADEL